MISSHSSAQGGSRAAVRVPLTASGQLIEAAFVARPNQLVVEARAHGRLVRAHMADRGRLIDLLTPGAPLLLAPRDAAGRKTAYQVVGVYQGEELISLDTQLPNRLVVAALSLGALPQFARYAKIQREVEMGRYRIDFRLGEGLSTCLLEVKSATKVLDGVAVFPDAPTERGRGQLDLLANAARTGQRSALVFIIQRTLGRALAPDDAVDAAFGRAMRAARVAGVEIYAYSCPLSPAGITLGAAVPVFATLEAVPR